MIAKLNKAEELKPWLWNLMKTINEANISFEGTVEARNWWNQSMNQAAPQNPEETKRRLGERVKAHNGDFECKIGWNSKAEALVMKSDEGN